MSSPLGSSKRKYHGAVAAWSAGSSPVVSRYQPPALCTSNPAKALVDARLERVDLLCRDQARHECAAVAQHRIPHRVCRQVAACNPRQRLVAGPGPRAPLRATATRSGNGRARRRQCCARRTRRTSISVSRSRRFASTSRSMASRGAPAPRARPPPRGLRARPDSKTAAPPGRRPSRVPRRDSVQLSSTRAPHRARA